LSESAEAWHIEGAGKGEYKKGFSVAELFPKNTTGIVSARDGLVIDQSKEELINRIKLFCNSDKSDQEIRQIFFGDKKATKYEQIIKPMIEIYVPAGIADISKGLGILTVAVVTRPFSFEGAGRRNIAERAFELLRDKVDAIITIPNDKLLSIIDRKTTLINAFRIVDVNT